MGDKTLEIKITATQDGVKVGVDSAAKSLKEAMAQIKSSVSNMNAHTKAKLKETEGIFSRTFTGIKSMVASFGATLAAYLSVQGLKSSVDAALNLQESVEGIQKVMGITAEEASVLNVALKLIGQTSEGYTSANMKLSQQVKSNEKDLNKLGIVTRDSNGILLKQTEIFNNSIAAMMNYKEGTDRDQMALYAFGRSAKEVYQYQELTNSIMQEATTIASQYGLVLDDKTSGATERAGQKLNAMKVVLEALKVKIGQELLPTIVQFSGYLANNGQMVITAFTYAVKGLITVWEDLRARVEVLSTFVITQLTMLYDIVKTVVKMMSDVLHGDFKGAIADAKSGYQEFINDGIVGNQQLVDNAEAAAARLKALWGKTGSERLAAVGTSNQVEGSNSKGFVSPESGTSGTKKKLTGDSKEAAFTLYNTEGIESKEIELSEAILEIEQQRLEDEKTLSLQRIEMKEAEAQALYDTGQISEQKLLQVQSDLSTQKYNLESETYSKISALWAEYPDKYREIKMKISAIDAEQNKTVIKSQTDLYKSVQSSASKILSPISSAVHQSVSGIVQGTTTLKDAIKNLCKSILASFVDMLVTMAEQWVTKQITMYATGEAAQKASATSQITTNAAVGASGAAASQASIPYVGPALAVAAAAAMMALILGYASASAAGGYDIPAGINPVVQTHAEEMILPAQYANMIRGMAAQQGRGGRGNVKNVTYKITAQDSKDVARSLRQARRNYSIKKG